MGAHILYHPGKAPGRVRWRHCLRSDGTRKVTHRSEGAARVEARRLGPGLAAYWCEAHDGWHVGRERPRPGGVHREAALLSELGERAAVQFLIEAGINEATLHRIRARNRTQNRPGTPV